MDSKDRYRQLCRDPKTGRVTRSSAYPRRDLRDTELDDDRSSKQKTSSGSEFTDSQTQTLKDRPWEPFGEVTRLETKMVDVLPQ